MEGDSLKLNFEIALEKIDTLTKHNNELLDKIEELEIKLEDLKLPPIIKPNTATSRYNSISREADAAMKRFTTKLKKELYKNGKSKQGEGQPV
jgi:hypothetical protein|tara:strand:+ start:255 stop:533 length:279 start_codon:yes stop_codon:yes gene_type:complete